MRNQNKANQQKSRNQNKPSQSHSNLTFLEHIHELRKRISWVVLMLIVASAAGYQIKDFLIDVVMAPLRGEQLVYLTPGGGFSFIFTLVIYFGALLTIPVAVYHLYKFLQPLILQTSRRFIAIFIMLSSLLATAGTLFGYFVAIPAALNFLTTFAGDTVSPNLTADSYLGFVVAYVLGLAALFQIPLLLFLYDHIKSIPPGGLSSSQRFVIIGATVAAAIITPTPDAMNMAIIAVPIIIVYEIGAFAVFIRHKLRARKVMKLSARAVRQEQAHRNALRLRQALQNQQQAEAEEEAERESQHERELQKATVVATNRQRRTWDGFTTGSRPAPMAAVIPKQPQTQQRVAMPTVSDRTSRPMRSLDGFSTI